MSSDQVVRMRGLPWQATEEDIKEFFNSLKFAPEGKEGLPSILLSVSPQGRPTGEGFARFDSEEDFEKALAKDKERMGQRYIEVFSCALSDMEKAHIIAQTATSAPQASSSSAAASTSASASTSTPPSSSSSASASSSSSSSSSHARVPQSEDEMRCVAVLRMRGLPFKATEADIESFFEQTGVHVLDGGVHICKGHDGRVTGEAYVEFGSEEDARRGLQRHRDQMGSRYIELFRSSKSELLNMLRRQQTARDLHREAIGHGSGHDRRAHHGQDGGWRGGRAGPDRGSGEWVVRLRGLPFSATEDEIANWFAPMPARRAHIVYNHSGRPSGDAFAEFDNEEEWEHAMSKNRQHMGSRYVEIFSSSKQELMNTLGPTEPPAPARGYHHGGPPFDNHPSSHMPHQYHSGGPGDFSGMPGSGSPYGISHYAAHHGFNPISQPSLAALGQGIGGPLSTPGVDPTVALLQLTSALSQQAAQIQARSHGVVSGQSQLDMMMKQAAASGWPSSASSAATTPAMAYPSPASMTPQYAAAALTSASHPAMQPALYPSQGAPSMAASSAPAADASKGVTLRIRGVPYRATPREIIDFFAGYDIIPESVQLGRDQGGYSTGEAWVSFRHAEEGYRALREKNRAYLGPRYVELFLA